MPMKIQYLSDLHLEFDDNASYLRRPVLKATGDVLVIAGDTTYLGYPGIGRLPFLRWAADSFSHVLLIPGNHEFYGGYDVVAGGKSWHKPLAKNMGYYQNSVVTIGDTDFILSTLWSHIPDENRQAVGYFLNDFHRITCDGHRYTVDDYNARHDESLSFIRQAVAGSHARHRVVVTHHVPTVRCSPRKLDFIRDGALAPAFTADLTGYIEQAPVDCWIYGHSHVNVEANIGGTRVTSNQLGYVYKGEYHWNGFQFDKYIEL